MALQKCKECGQDVSSEAAACPHCGRKNSSLAFAKALPGAVVALAVLGYCAFNPPGPGYDTRTGVGLTEVPAGAVPACAPSQFIISKLNATVRYNYATLTGIVANNCSSARGVELKWTAFNEDGSVAFSSEFWPASTTNIPAGASYPFETSNRAPRGKWTFTVEAINVQTW